MIRGIRQADFDRDLSAGGDRGAFCGNGNLEGRVIRLLAENEINKQEKAIEYLHSLHSSSSVAVIVGSYRESAPRWEAAYPRRGCEGLRRTAPTRRAPRPARLGRRAGKAPADRTNRHRDGILCVGLPHHIHRCRKVSVRISKS